MWQLSRIEGSRFNILIAALFFLAESSSRRRAVEFLAWSFEVLRGRADERKKWCRRSLVRERFKLKLVVVGIRKWAELFKMNDAKNDKDREATTRDTSDYVLHLPRPLNLEEKKYLLAVKRGDLPNVKRLLQIANKVKVNIDSNRKEINARTISRREKVVYISMQRTIFFEIWKNLVKSKT